LTFFIFLPILLKIGFNFLPSMITSITGTAICYWIYTLILNKYFNITL
jgi:hypothetical protein